MAGAARTDPAVNAEPFGWAWEVGGFADFLGLADFRHLEDFRDLADFTTIVVPATDLSGPAGPGWD